MCIMLVITFVFKVVYKTGMPNFSLFVLSGIFPWMFFANALSEATFSLVSHKKILYQFNFPKVIIPLSSLMSNFLNYVIGWIIIYPVFLIFNVKILFLLPLLFAIFLMHMIFVSGLGLLLSIVNVFFRDLSHFLGVILMLWLWVTPVFYSVDMIPVEFRWVTTFNPMSAFIIFYREILFVYAVPRAETWISVFIWTAISAVVGLTVFARFQEAVMKKV